MGVHSCHIVQSVLEMANQQHVLGSLEENDPDADVELEEDENEDASRDEQDDTANDLADALAKQAHIR
jgi:hypothetical protein